MIRCSSLPNLQRVRDFRSKLKIERESVLTIGGNKGPHIALKLVYQYSKANH